MKIIEFDDVVLTPLYIKDIRTLYKWINNPELVVYNSRYKPIDFKSHTEWFDKVRKAKDSVIFAIRLKKNKKLIGSCQLHTIDHISRSAELQIRIGELEYQSRGYGAKAINLLLNYGFNEINLNRIYLYVFEDNKKAINLYRKAGLKKEGILKEAIFIGGTYKNIIIMAILKSEYRKYLIKQTI